MARRGGRRLFHRVCGGRAIPRSSTAEEYAREDLEYYAAEDDKGEETYSSGTMPG